nr:hypothetical protein [Tanacetum cinerariifolium]
MSCSCKRPDSDAVCYTKLLDSLTRWNGHFFWVDSFAYPTSFMWHTDKNISRDPFPKSTEFIADDYVVLVAHPAPFRKFSKPFLCLIGMRHNYTMDEDSYPTFLRDDGTGGDPFPKSTEFIADDYVVLVAHPAPFRKFSEPFLCLIGMRHNYTLDEDSYPTFLRDDGTVADPTNVKVGEHEHAEEEARLLDSIVGRVVPLLPGEYETSGEVATSGKSSFVLKELLASSMLNVKAGVAAVATLPMVTSSVSTTPEHESGAPADSVTGLNLPVPLVHLKGLNLPVPLVHLEDDSIISSAVIPPVTSLVYASLFHDSNSTETVKADVTGPFYSARQYLSMSSQELDAETMHQVFVPQRNVLNDSLLDDYDVSQEFVDHLAPPALMRTEHCLSKRKMLESEYEKQADLLKAKDEEIENLKAQLLLKETEAAEAAHLRAQVSADEAREKIYTNKIDALKQRNVCFENEKESLSGKVVELQSLVSTKDLELEDLNVAVYSIDPKRMVLWIRCMRWRPHVPAFVTKFQAMSG